MKTTRLWLIRRTLTVLVLISPLSSFGQLAEFDDALKPSDFGIDKIRFAATPGVGQVAVFRMETESKGVVTVWDKVGFNGGKECVTHVIIHDMGVLDPERKGLWGIRGEGFGGHHEHFRLIRGGVKEDSAEYVFEETKNGEKMEFVYRFKVFLASREEIKGLHPDLPDKIGNGFSWSSGIKLPNKRPKHGKDNEQKVPSNLETALIDKKVEQGGAR